MTVSRWNNDASKTLQCVILKLTPAEYCRTVIQPHATGPVFTDNRYGPYDPLETLIKPEAGPDGGLTPLHDIQRLHIVLSTPVHIMPVLQDGVCGCSSIHIWAGSLIH